MKALVGAAAMVLIASAAAACNGDSADSTTLEEYFEKFERINSDAEGRLNDLRTPDIGGGTSFEASRDSFARYYDDYATETEDIIDDLDGLDPPDEVAAEHNRFVDAIGDLPSVTYNYADRIRDAESEEAFQEAFLDTAEGEAVGARITEACSALQAIADENEIDVDLKCDA